MVAMLFSFLFLFFTFYNDLPGNFHPSQEIITKADESKEGTLDFREFVNYMIQHERDLKLAFSDLDRNEDGKLTQKQCCTNIT